MAHHHEETGLTPEDLKFREFIIRGDDFCKIELYRYAVGWYRKAVELKPDSEEARTRFQDCRSKIKSESRTILIIAAVGAFITVAAILMC